jgi:uncharacterized membrane protein YeiH
MNFLQIIDLAGTFVFAVSGTLSAANKQRLDSFGVLFVAFVTAVGGGTTRDIILGIHPVVWVEDVRYFAIILLGVWLTLIYKQYIAPLKKTLFLFDSIGIGLFTILGMQKALMIGVTPVIAIIMGMVSATVGGVLRDTLCNDLPLIFHRELYATACVAGAVLFLLLDALQVENTLNMCLTIAVVILIRLLAVRYRIHLPTIVLEETAPEEEEG